MALYTVVKPCVVGLLHYTRPTTEPIEVDDDVAAELVEAGDLVPYRTAAGPFGDFGKVDEIRFSPEVAERIPPVIAEVAEKPRGRRKAAED